MTRLGLLVHGCSKTRQGTIKAMIEEDKRILRVDEEEWD